MNTPDQPQTSPRHLSTEDKWVCAMFLTTVVLAYGVTWPLRNIALVYWVYGVNGYHAQGIRLLHSKPAIFSNGEPVPSFPDFVTGMAAVLLACFLSYLLVTLVTRIYARRVR